MASPKFEVKIVFAKSTSRSYEDVMRYVLSIPAYMRIDDLNIVHFESLMEFCEFRGQARALSSMISQWRSALFTFEGHPITADGVISLSEELDRMRELAGAKEIAFDDNGQIIYTLYDPLPNNIIQM